MPGGSVRFVLDDGEALTLAGSDLAEVYECLWRLTAQKGAISVAALIRVSSHADPMQSPIALDKTQSAAMREAIALLRA